MRGRCLRDGGRVSVALPWELGNTHMLSSPHLPTHSHVRPFSSRFHSLLLFIALLLGSVISRLWSPNFFLLWNHIVPLFFLLPSLSTSYLIVPFPSWLLSPYAVLGPPPLLLSSCFVLKESLIYSNIKRKNSFISSEIICISLLGAVIIDGWPQYGFQCPGLLTAAVGKEG